MNDKKSKRGGLQNPPGGRPKLPPGQKRQSHSIILAPGTKEMLQLIARQTGLDGWGHVVDRLAKLALENTEIINLLKEMD